ncbi:Lactonase, 7-bladed beta-propeller [compost metagenome]
MRWVWVTAIVAGLGGCVAEGGSERPEGKLYLSNVLNNTVTILDAKSGRVLKKLESGTLPHNFAFSTDQKRLFLTNTGSQSVSVIDTETDRIIHDIALAPLPDNAAHRRTRAANAKSCKDCHPNPVGVLPAGIARTPDGEHFVVTNLKGPTLSKFNARTYALEATVKLTYPVQKFPSNLIFHPTRDELYVLNRPEFKGVGRLTVMDGAFRVKRHLPVIKQPWGMAVSADGRELFIASRATNKIQVWDTRSWTLSRTLISGNGPVAIHLSPEGKLYTANYYTSRPSYMSVLDPNTGRTLKRIETAADLTMLAVDPTQRFMYLANCGGNKVQVIDLTVDRVVFEMHGGPFPLDVAFLPKRASAL